MKKTGPVFLKIIYFDETAAQDYLDITNGGRLDWSKEENKKRAAEILAEIEAQAKGSFNIISFLKDKWNNRYQSNRGSIKVTRHYYKEYTVN